ncbi:hypothetical protein JNO12_05590 [Erwinia aphidicola]|nr:hypothetical protein [Erwinia aphidicola]
MSATPAATASAMPAIGSVIAPQRSRHRPSGKSKDAAQHPGAGDQQIQPAQHRCHH